jgi:hypothetical protein
LEFRDEKHAKSFQDRYYANKAAIGAKVAEFAQLDSFGVLASQDPLVVS